MKSATLEIPVPSHYLDANAYLRDYFQFRKKSEEKFSFEIWAKELGLKSRSHLRMILMGKKKITQGFIETFCRTSGLNSNEQEYFYFMVQYTQSKNQADRRLYSSKMIQSLRARTGVVEIENHFRFLSNPLLPRVMTLLTFDDFKATPGSVANALGLDFKIAMELLNELREIGLAQEQSDDEGCGFWKATIKVFKIPDRFGDLALMRYHEAILQEATKALRDPDPSKRFRSLIFPLSADELQELYKALDEFMSTTLAKFVSDQFNERRLYQLNSSFFPVSIAAPVLEET